MNETLVLVLSSFKFAMTFPVAMLEFGFGIPKTLLLTNIGGLSGVFLFTYLSGFLIKTWRKIFGPPETEGRIFSVKKRRIVKIRQKYGLPGIAFFTPLLLSIPVGAFIAVRYFHNKKVIFLLLLSSNFFWSIIYCLFYELCYDAYKHYF